jgi:cell shape-determining protein MreC
VRLITDGQSSVGVSYGPASTSAAVVDGQGSGKPLTADLIPTNTHLSVGQVFTTSGFQGAVYPAAIPVARVATVHNGATASQESVTLDPIVDLDHLRYVAVVLWGPG